MKIERNTIAALFYTVSNAESNAILQKVTEQPQEFLFGHGQLLEVFEKNLLGLMEGDTFSFVARSEEAYGPVDPHAIFDVPLSTFEEEDGSIDDEAVQVGNIFPMEDDYGNRHLGKIIRKMKDRVTMDFNHPMAGKTLRFEGNVVAVRNAKPEELPKSHECGCGSHDHHVHPEHKSIFEH